MANLITLDDYKTSEGIENLKDNVRLESLITSVSQLVKTYCANSIVDFYSSDKVETITVDWDTNVIQLSESPVNSVSLVEERENYSSAYSTLTTGANEYYLDATTDALYRTNGSGYVNWKKGPGAVRVTYRAGYADTPADLKLAVIDLVTYYFKDEYKARRTIGGSSMENQTTSSQWRNVSFPDHIKRVLDLYKLAF